MTAKQSNQKNLRKKLQAFWFVQLIPTKHFDDTVLLSFSESTILAKS